MSGGGAARGRSRTATSGHGTPNDHSSDAEVVAEDIFDLSDIGPADPSAVDRFAADLYEWVTTVIEETHDGGDRASNRMLDLEQYDVEQFDVRQTV